MRKLFFLIFLLQLSLLEARRDWMIFNSKSVELVDIDHNFLFRGPIPRNMKNEFCYDALIQALQEKAHLPEKFNLVIFSFLTKERDEELNFLKKLEGHFSLKPPLVMKILHGQVYWWQVRAHLKQASSTMEELLDQTFDGIRLEFPRLVSTLTRYMEEKNQHPNVIYVHCRHGVNRTSAVLVGYEMFRYNSSFEEAWNLHAEGRPLYKPDEQKNFLRLYETYLRGRFAM